MDFLSHILHLQVTEKNKGLCLVWECPRCEEQRDYYLIVSKGNFSLAGLEFSEPTTMLDLRCSKCGFELKVALSESQLLAQASEATIHLKRGELTAEAYRAAILALSARFLNDLASLTQTWKCSKCGEANPITFDACWSCQSKHNSGMG